MTTQHLALQSITESAVGTPDYIVALRKLNTLVKTVADESTRKSVAGEVLAANIALKASK
jgi:hypothetical protein